MTNTYTDAPNNINTHVNLLKMYGFDKNFDGVPFHHFNKLWLKPFLNACGQISVDGATLKERYMGIDPGANDGPIIAPGLPLGQYNGVQQIHANDAQMRQCNNRDRRLYAVLLSHIEITSYLYMQLEEDFANMGRRAVLYVAHVGPKLFQEHEIAAMETEWAQMGVTSLRLKIEDNTLGKYYNEVMLRSADFVPEKSFGQCRAKFLDGLPPQMSAEVEAELSRPNPLYTFPAQYIHPHPLAGQMHPFAGQPDLFKLMNAFTTIWQRKLKQGLIRAPQANLAQNDDFNIYPENYDEHGLFVGRGRGRGKGKGAGFQGKGKGGRGGGGRGGQIDFDENTRCFQCGGLGHIWRFTRDGVTYQCPTRTQISREILDAIVYPHIPARANEAVDEEEAPADYNGPVDDEVADVAQAAGNWWD